MSEPQNQKDSSQLKFVRFVLPGDPTPLARMRLGLRRLWDSQSELKICRGIELQSQFSGRMLTGPLSLEVNFYFAPAQSLSRKKRLASMGNYHIFRPDLSNCIKFIEDIAIGVAYKDDCIIASIYANKLYDDKPARTEFILREIVNGQNRCSCKNSLSGSI